MQRGIACIALLFVSCAIFTASCSEGPPGPKLPVATVRIDGKSITVELARTPREQERGLMYRRRLGADRGMLFMYDSPRVLSFWMKNTRIPLDIAFISGRGRILQIERMQPYDSETRHVSRVPAQYALEMNGGWFEKNGVAVGDTMEISNSQIPN